MNSRLERVRRHLDALTALEATFGRHVSPFVAFKEDHRQRPAAYRPNDLSEYRAKTLAGLAAERNRLTEARDAATAELMELLPDGLRLSVRINEAASETALDRASRRVHALADAGYAVSEIGELAKQERDAAMMEALRQEAPWIIRAKAGRDAYGGRELDETIAETMETVESHADAFRDRDALQLRETMREIRRRGAELDARYELAVAEVNGVDVARKRLEAAYQIGGEQLPKEPAERPDNGLSGDASAVLAGSAAPGIGTTVG